jgi:pimeloyl-ACP methyl ester carboxylesterase
MAEEVLHSEERGVEANGIEIVYDTFGERTAKPLLLIMGLGQQLIAWDEAFCAEFASRGYYVVRYDNRDIGLSTKFEEAGEPDVLAMLKGEKVAVPYTLRDMAEDAVGLLDALEIESAHVVGVSMGGMIAQLMCIHHPHRVRTLTSIMSSTGDPSLPPPTPEAAAILTRPAPEDREGYIEHSLRNWKILHGPVIPYDQELEERTRDRAGRSFDRGLNPLGVMRQYAAIIACGSRKGALQSVSVPALVIHGDADPLVPVECGVDTANAIPGAELMIIEGMGHNIPPVVAPRVIEAIVRHAV